jgi:hypothetical protein
MLGAISIVALSAACGEVAGPSGADAAPSASVDALATSPDAGAPDAGFSGLQTMTLMAIEETSVTDRDPAANLDSQQLAVESTSGWLSRSYVRFRATDIPAGAIIDEAKLELYYCACDGIDNIGVYAGAGPWMANTLTWANQPGTTGTALDALNLNPNFDDDFLCGNTEVYVAAAGTMASKPGWYVTDLVRDWHQGTANYGLVLKAEPENIGVPAGQAMGAYFGHTEGLTRCGEKPPRLVVSYRMPL